MGRSKSIICYLEGVGEGGDGQIAKFRIKDGLGAIEDQIENISGEKLGVPVDLEFITDLGYEIKGKSREPELSLGQGT